MQPQRTIGQSRKRGVGMPCYVCNPQCGRCRPPRRGMRRCPYCNVLAMPSDDSDILGENVCPRCGRTLPEPESTKCEYTRRLCGIPCVRAVEEAESGLSEPCPWGDDFGR